MDPPAPNRPVQCLECETQYPSTYTVKVYGPDEQGAVEGDVRCSHCDTTLRQGVLLREPDSLR